MQRQPHGGAENGHMEVAKLLLVATTDVNLAIVDETTPLFIGAETATWRSRSCSSRLLLVSILAFNDQITSLFIGAENGHTEVAKLLIEAIADVDLAVDDETNPLSLVQ